MKSLLCLIILSLTLQSSAFESEIPYSFEQEDQLLTELQELVNYFEMRTDVVYEIDGTTVNDRCVAFMNQKLELGPIGISISKELQAHQEFYKPLLESASMKNNCSLYKDMTVEKKAMVWTALLALMAHFESSCNSKALAKGTNGKAIGYFQLHQNKEHLYDGNLNTCERGSGSHTTKSVRCALGMLNRQIIRTESLFSHSSYWEVLRPRGKSQKADDIRSTLQRLSICAPPTSI
jgi:hypothetical protein